MLARYFQVDTDRLSGTTGGPLVDAEGALAGIQVFNRRMGVEVVIPADLALARAKILEEKGSIARPYLGVRSQEVPLSEAAKTAVKGRQETGLLLVWVEKGKAAERAGLEVGDILVGVAGPHRCPTTGSSSPPCPSTERERRWTRRSSGAASSAACP